MAIDIKTAANGQNDSGLRRESARALHEQLSDRLRAEFFSTYKQGDQLPTEEAICHAHGLSRVTVRRAIQTLVHQGFLIRRQGKGTFLASQKPRIIHAIDRFGPFMDAFAESAEAVHVKLLEYGWAGEAQVPEPFRTAGDKFLVYDRLYETGGTPHALVRILLPCDLGERVSREDASLMGVYQILEQVLGVLPVRAEFQISSELPDAKLAGALRVSPSTPLLILNRTSYDESERAVERTIHHLVPDVYKLSVSVLRS